MIKKSILYIGATWMMIGVAILLLVLLEGLMSGVFFARDRLIATGGKPTGDGVQANPGAPVSYSDGYSKEFAESSRLRWESYVYWRRQPYRGGCINITADGLRVVPGQETGFAAARPLRKLFVFGGSAVWGTGARDAFTLPALLGRELKHQGVDTEVVNFGESGYVSTQEVIALLLQLQKGNIPDFAIFYDGANDIYSAYQQGAAGLPQNEFNRVKEFNILTRPGDLFKAALQGAANQSAVMRLIKSAGRRTGIDRNNEDLGPERAEIIIAKAAATYRGNMELVRHLAAAYGFQYVFYWQPTVFEKENPTSHEKSEYEKQRHLAPLIREAYRRLSDLACASKDQENFRGLQGVFSQETNSVYIDWIHLSEKGNEIVAREISAQIAALVRSRKTVIP